ncbi:MAG: hypothetical protein RL134_1332 [Actinomycetota bacterium]|jgi:hypothetical protein
MSDQQPTPDQQPALEQQPAPDQRLDAPSSSAPAAPEPATPPPAPPVWPAHATGDAAAGAPTYGVPGQIPAPAYPPAPGYVVPPPPGYPAQSYAYPPAQTTSTNAVVGLVLSIVSWLLCPIIPAIVALVLAKKSGEEIAASQGRVGGEGLNTATKIVSWINIAFYGAFIVIGGAILLIAVVLGAASNA